MPRGKSSGHVYIYAFIFLNLAKKKSSFILVFKLFLLFNFSSKKDHLVLITFYYFSVLVASLLTQCLQWVFIPVFLLSFLFPHRSSAMFIKHRPPILHEFSFSPSFVYWDIFYKARAKPVRH